MTTNSLIWSCFQSFFIFIAVGVCGLLSGCGAILMYNKDYSGVYITADVTDEDPPIDELVVTITERF
jgi:hypothetical protein